MPHLYAKQQLSYKILQRALLDRNGYFNDEICSSPEIILSPSRASEWLADHQGR